MSASLPKLCADALFDDITVPYHKMAMQDEPNGEDEEGEILLNDTQEFSDKHPKQTLLLSEPFGSQDLPLPESFLLKRKNPTTLTSQSSSNVLDIVTVEDRGHQDLMTADLSFSSGSTLQHTSTPDLLLSVKAIANRIRSSHVSSTQYERQFLPYDKLRAITNESNVRSLLRTRFPHYNEGTINGLVAKVLGRKDPEGIRHSPPRRKIFAILIMMEQIHFIQLFIEGELCDSDLPLEIKTVNSNDTDSVYQLCKRRPGFAKQLASPTFSSTSTMLSTSDYLDPVRCLDVWSSQQMEYFVLHQRRICIPFFQLPGEQIKFYCLHDNPILPFMDPDENEQQPIVCGSGSVRKVKIHSAQYTHTGGGKVQEGINKYFAVKELRTGTKHAHDREVDVFKKIGLAKADGPPRHLIQLQFSYLLGDRYYLVFPWADGNLRQFWEKRPSPSPAQWDQTKWFFTQCEGLVRALGRIHHVTGTTFTRPNETISKKELDMIFTDFDPMGSPKEWGRHGDIKPENILWFQKHDGLIDFLVLSDFGLTSFNTADSRSRVHHDAIGGYTGTYRPPEFDLQSEISQSYDIWSLGCVFLEFVSWFLLGFNQTQESFTTWRGQGGGKHTWYSEDTFFVMESSLDPLQPFGEVKVKPAVIAWIEKLHGRPNCTRPLHEFLNFIEGAMLRPDPQERWDCKEIRAEIQMVVKECGSEEFATRCVHGVREPKRFPLTRPKSGTISQGSTLKASSGELLESPTTPAASHRKSKELSLLGMRSELSQAYDLQGITGAVEHDF